MVLEATVKAVIKRLKANGRESATKIKPKVPNAVTKVIYKLH